MRARGLALCLIAAIPIIMIEVRSADQEAKQGLADAHKDARLMLATADDRYDDVLVQAHTVIEFVTAATVQNSSGESCNAYMKDVKARYAWMTGVGVTAPDGHMICNSDFQPGRSAADKPYFRKAVETKQFVVSDFHIGSISHKPVISMISPVVNEAGQISRLIGVGIDLREFSGMLSRQRLGDDVSTTIFDSHGTVIARYPDSDKFLGQSMADNSLFQAIETHKTGDFEGTGLDGQQRVFSFKPFSEGSSYVAVGILKDPILTRIHQHLLNKLAIVLAIVLGAALITLFASEYLVFSPARKLTRAARALGEGHFEAVPDLTSSMPEISEMVAAFHDMANQLKQREAQLRDSEAAAQTINRNLLLGEQIANAGYWRMEFPDERLAWSEGVYRIFGVDPKGFSLTVQNAIELYHPEDRTKVADAIEMALSFQRDFEHTLRILRPDGEIRQVLSRGFCELGRLGDVQAVFGAVIDVTVQKETEARLTAARHAAEAANRAKSDFLSNMSHELRTPLTSIIGFCDLLLMRTRSVEVRRYLKLQREAGQHLLTLISDILDHSKIEAGKLELEAIPFNLRALVRSSLEVMEHEARRRNLTLNGTVGVAVPETVIGDPKRLKQILLNLIGNALKFTKEGGVEVEIEPTGSAGDVIALNFSVSDTGTGIPEHKMKSLFQRFTQIDASTTRQFGGTGLGLSICHDLVEAMGGTIGVESIVGEGSKFWFTLRLLTTLDKDSAIPETSEPQLRHSRILLAEDSPINQLLFSELLQTLGHDVVTVGDGAAAVEAVRNNGDFDLVLMDVQMPIMDGLVATRTIRGFDETRLPIIGLTANAMQDDVDRCLAAGMDAHLSKPVDVAMLADMIRRVTSG